MAKSLESRIAELERRLQERRATESLRDGHDDSQLLVELVVLIGSVEAGDLPQEFADLAGRVLTTVMQCESADTPKYPPAIALALADWLNVDLCEFARNEQHRHVIESMVSR